MHSLSFFVMKYYTNKSLCSFQNYKSCELLFDNETQGSGTYLPDLPDPEHCNAHNTMMWELAYLQV